MNSPTKNTFPLRLSSLLLVLALPVSPSALADEPAETADPHHWSAGIGFESFTDKTVPDQVSKQMNIPVGLLYETEEYTFEASIPYIERSAPSGKLAFDHHHESHNEHATAAPIVTNSGLGDMTMSLQRRMLNETDAPLSLFLRGEVKLATADVAKGLGTGMNDYFGEVKASKSWGAFTGKASAGYAVFGSPGKVEVNGVTKYLYYNNIYFGSIGSAYELDERLNAELNLELGQASQIGGAQQRDLSAGMKYKFSTDKSLRMQVLKSITPGLNIWGVGAYLLTAM